MNFRVLISALAAGALSMLLIDTAQAYPTTARSGTTTVTGVYRPLDLNLQLVSGQFFYDSLNANNQTFAFTGQLGGNFTSTYGAYGNAGNWTLNLGFNAFNSQNKIRADSIDTSILAPVVVPNVTDSDNGTDTITVFITAANRPVGSLVYNGGLLGVGPVPLPAEDTPQAGDLFLLYAASSGEVFRATVENILNPLNNITNPDDFYLALAKNLLHLGPYVSIEDNVYALDDGTLTGRTMTRVNADCDQGRQRCGSVPSNQFFASSVPGDSIRSVPEPASAVLVGLGLMGLAFGHRRRQSRLRTA